MVLLYQSSAIPVTLVHVMTVPSYTGGWLVWSLEVLYSPQIDASTYTFHILSGTPGGFERLESIMLMLAASKEIGVALVATFFGLEDYVRYTKFWNASATPTNVSRIYEHTQPMLIKLGSNIGLMSEQLARMLNIGWKHGELLIITVDCQWFDMSKMGEFMYVNFDGIMICVWNIVVISGSDNVMLNCKLEMFAWKRCRILDIGSCKIAISAANGSEQVIIVTSCPGDWSYLYDTRLKTCPPTSFKMQ